MRGEGLCGIKLRSFKAAGAEVVNRKGVCTVAKGRFKVLWVFASCIPIVVWAFADHWAPQVLGAERYARLAGSGVATAIIVCLMMIPVAASIAFFLKPMLSFFGGSPTERRIRATGRPAKGKVLRLAENSGGGVVTVNDQPYLNLTLEVDDGFRAPYDVSFDAVIPRSILPQFRPGAVIPVKVDADDPQKVVIDWNSSPSVT